MSLHISFQLKKVNSIGLRIKINTTVWTQIMSIIIKRIKYIGNIKYIKDYIHYFCIIQSYLFKLLLDY